MRGFAPVRFLFAPQTLILLGVKLQNMWVGPSQGLRSPTTAP